MVFLGLFLFAILYAAEIFVSKQVNTFVGSQGLTWANAYDPASSTAMDEILYPGLAIMIAFGAVIEVINQSQRKKGGGEQYI